MDKLTSVPTEIGNTIPVMIFSPYSAGSEEELSANIEYAKEACYDSLEKGECPLAPHLAWTNLMDPKGVNEKERLFGMAMEMAWVKVSSYVVFYTDLGWSSGMLWEKEQCTKLDIPWVERKIR